jgi:hypothetical protein
LLRDLHLPAVCSALISVAYFRAGATDQSLSRRLLASAHGATISLLYCGAWVVYLTHHGSDAFARPFAQIMTLPLALIVVALVVFRGRRIVHLLQVPNLLCLLWVWLRGTVVVTGFLF